MPRIIRNASFFMPITEMVYILTQAGTGSLIAETACNALSGVIKVTSVISITQWCLQNSEITETAKSGK